MNLGFLYGFSPLLLAIVLSGKVSTTRVEGRVGIQIDYKTGLIGHVYFYSPARAVGLRKGDIVLEVDGEKGTDKNRHEIHGDPGSTVTLKIRRRQEEFTVRIERVERWKIKER
jgi:C-terminal processing protease CtpA/Prc